MKTATHYDLTPETVAQLRKDFLGIMSRVASIRSFEDARKFQVAARAWADTFEGFLVQIRQELEGRKYQSHKTPANTEWAEYYLKNQKDVWDFQYELRHALSSVGKSIPGEGDLAKERQQFNDWQAYKQTGLTLTEEGQFNQWVGKKILANWEARVRSKARVAWKWLDQFAQWTMNDGYSGGGGKPIRVQVPSVDNVELEGFKVRVIGWEGTDFQKKGMEIFKAGLRYYRQRAATVYPWILKHQLPLIADFSDTSGRGQGAATYKGNSIEVSFWVIHEENPQKFTHAVAHEMGHHAWRTAIDSEGRKFWGDSISGKQTTLDMREVLKLLRPGETLWDLEKRISLEDPILYLQLQTLIHNRLYQAKDLISLKSIQEYLDNGGDPLFRVPLEPITGYAGKNDDEAFSEAVGMLVGYGPKAVLPAVIHRLKLLLPEVRVASKSASEFKMSYPHAGLKLASNEAQHLRVLKNLLLDVAKEDEADTLASWVLEALEEGVHKTFKDLESKMVPLKAVGHREFETGRNQRDVSYWVTVKHPDSIHLGWAFKIDPAKRWHQVGADPHVKSALNPLPYPHLPPLEGALLVEVVNIIKETVLKGDWLGIARHSGMVSHILKDEVVDWGYQHSLFDEESTATGADAIEITGPTPHVEWDVGFKSKLITKVDVQGSLLVCRFEVVLSIGVADVSLPGDSSYRFAKSVNRVASTWMTRNEA